jgi:hypothetical protein
MLAMAFARVNARQARFDSSPGGGIGYAAEKSGISTRQAVMNDRNPA